LGLGENVHLCCCLQTLEFAHLIQNL